MWRGQARFVSPTKSSGFNKIGPVVLRPPGIAMEARGKGEVSPLLSCAFDRDLFEKVTGLYKWPTDLLSRCSDLSNARSLFIMRSIASELTQGGFGHEMAIEAMAQIAMVELARMMGREFDFSDKVMQLAPWQVRRIEDRLESAEFGWPTLDELAQICGISAGHLSRTFHKTQGVTIKEFSESIRLNRARELLASGRMAKEVAAILGFATTSSFSVAFKRVVGENARNFRMR